MNEAMSIIAFIKEQTGVSLQPCQYFSGVHENNGERYINVDLPVRVSESADYLNLCSFSLKSRIIRRVEPNGVSRLAIFF